MKTKYENAFNSYWPLRSVNFEYMMYLMIVFMNCVCMILYYFSGELKQFFHMQKGVVIFYTSSNKLKLETV